MDEYNLTQMQGGPMEAMQAVNVSSNGVFGVLLLLAFGVILYTLLTRFMETKNALLGSVISMMGASFLLLGMSLINSIAFFILLAIFLITLIAVIKTDGR